MSWFKKKKGSYFFIKGEPRGVVMHTGINSTPWVASYLKETEGKVNLAKGLKETRRDILEDKEKEKVKYLDNLDNHKELVYNQINQKIREAVEEGNNKPTLPIFEIHITTQEFNMAYFRGNNVDYIKEKKELLVAWIKTSGLLQDYEKKEVFITIEDVEDEEEYQLLIDITPRNYYDYRRSTQGIYTDFY